jgi:hypothetical protein
MEGDCKLALVERRDYLSEFEFRVSATVPAYCIREFVTSCHLCVMKGA